MNPYNFASLFFAFSAFLLSLLILLKRQDAVAKSYFVFSFFVSLWGVNFSILLSDNASYESALFAARFGNVSALFIPVSWLHFCLINTKEELSKRKWVVFLYCLAVLISVFGFSQSFVPKVEPYLVFTHYTRPGPLYYLHTAIFYGVVPLGFVVLIKKIRFAGTPRHEVQQLKWIAIATAAGFSGGTLTFLPVFKIPIPQYGVFLMPMYPLVMAYVLIRKRFLDEFEMVQAAHRDKLAAIGTLATSINHEIRNPLYIIQGLADSFLSSDQEGIYQNGDEALRKAKEILTKTRDQSTRAMDIMKRFAVFAKQNLKREIVTEEVSLTELLESIMPLVAHELELDKIELVRNIPDDLPPVRADRRHLEEIFFNLIVNACQAMKEGGRIEITARKSEQGVEVEVNDNGPGIPADKLNQIFEPFYTTKEEGTGLGLYVTKQLIERNGGRIEAQSKPGVGTTFLLEFRK